MKLQFVGRHVAPEMLALWLVELILTFTLTLILVTPATATVGLSSVNPAIVCALTVGFTGFVIGIYRPKIFSQVGTLVKSTAIAAMISFPAVWLVCKAVGLSTYLPIGYDSLRPIKIVLLWSAGLLLTRLLFMVGTRCGVFAHRVAVITSESSLNFSSAILSDKKNVLSISTLRPENASASQLALARFHTLVLPSGSGLIVPEIVSEYSSRGIKLQSEPEFWEQHLRRVDLRHVTPDDFVNHTPNRSTLSLGFTRALDLTLCLGLLVATLPITCAVSLLVRLDSRGPVFYRQKRVGLNGETFTLFKFRSMRVDAETAGPTWAQMRDPRVTRLGLFMRKTRIDELPQLLNIFRGEMSFIGPRPERPHFVEQLEALIPCYGQRCLVKPGLTGWAQVNYPYGASVEDARAKLSFDLYYVKNRSLFLDILILLSTVRVILFQEGAR